LTAADSASHDFLVKSLQSLIPDAPVISEEDEAIRDVTDPANLFWLVNPLDRTKEFLKGTGELTVNVALIEYGQPVLGVVHAPAPTAACEIPAAGDKLETTISTRRANFSRLSVVASKDHAGPRVKAILTRMPEAKVQSMGSLLKFCLVAEGTAEIYLRDLPTMEWNRAAAQCIVQATAGNVLLTGWQALVLWQTRSKKPGGNVIVGGIQFDWAALISYLSTRMNSFDCSFSLSL
jgi:3'(2'), 5'-bisphosphate nucleotidase